MMMMLLLQNHPEETRNDEAQLARRDSVPTLPEWGDAGRRRRRRETTATTVAAPTPRPTVCTSAVDTSD
jgi:hypothetical protein